MVKDRDVGIVSLDGVKWAKPATGPSKPIQRVNQVLSPGDVIYVEPMEERGNTSFVKFRKFPAPWW